MEKKIAVIGAILENPQDVQELFNKALAMYKHLIRGRMGIPFVECDISVVSITVYGTLDEINSLTGQLGNISGVTVKTAFSKKSVDW